MLGKGAYSYVELREVEGVKYAVKIMHLRPESARREYATPGVFVRELLALRTLVHPNLLSLVGVELEACSLLLPLAECNLQQLIKKGSSFNERQIAFGIACAMRHLQRVGIYHSDVKAENVLLFPEEGGYRAVLADFGHCVFSFREGDLPTLISTRGYRAPEVHLAVLNRLTDPCNVGYPAMVWAFGCILYLMYMKSKPFRIGEKYDATHMVLHTASEVGMTEGEIARAVLDYPLLHERLTSCVRNLHLPQKDADLLLSKCLKFNPKERIPLESLCKHAYFRSCGEPVEDTLAQPESYIYMEEHEVVSFLRPFMAGRHVIARTCALYDRVAPYFSETEEELLAVACFCLVSKVLSCAQDLREDCQAYDESVIATMEERILTLADYVL